MNETAFKKHEIYNSLMLFRDHELNDMIHFMDFIRYKSQRGQNKIMKMEGILKGYDIDFSVLKKFRQETWRHLDEEFAE